MYIYIYIHNVSIIFKTYSATRDSKVAVHTIPGYLNIVKGLGAPN